MKVYPSGAAAVAICKPTMLPAPARLSMITCCLNRGVSSAASKRPMMSVLPPGGHGMTIRTARSGQPAAHTAPAGASDETSSMNAFNNGDLEVIEVLRSDRLALDRTGKELQSRQCPGRPQHDSCRR